MKAVTAVKLTTDKGEKIGYSLTIYYVSISYLIYWRRSTHVNQELASYTVTKISLRVILAATRYDE